MRPLRLALLIALFLLMVAGLPSTVFAEQADLQEAGYSAASPESFGQPFSLRDKGFSEFSASLPITSASLPVGFYAPGILASTVQAQPKNNPAYVAPADGVITLFGLAAGYGSTGLLAHNTMDGAFFFQLKQGQTVYLVMGDQRVQAYKITSILRYQALQPTSPYSSFIDLDQPGGKISVTELFYKIFDAPGRLILQTCIAAEGIDSWGRLFVLAEPVEPGATLVMDERQIATRH